MLYNICMHVCKCTHVYIICIWIWQERELGDINNKLKVNVFNWTSELYIKSFLITIILCYSNYLVSCCLFINLIKWIIFIISLRPKIMILEAFKTYCLTRCSRPVVPLILRCNHLIKIIYQIATWDTFYRLGT